MFGYDSVVLDAAECWKDLCVFFYQEKIFHAVASYRLLVKCKEQPMQYTHIATGANH